MIPIFYNILLAFEVCIVVSTALLKNLRFVVGDPSVVQQTYTYLSIVVGFFRFTTVTQSLLIAGTAFGGLFAICGIYQAMMLS